MGEQAKPAPAPSGGKAKRPEPRINVYGHGNVRWLNGNQPRPAQIMYTGDCRHPTVRAVAWGWDWTHYELIECIEEPCRARAWADQNTKATTPWMVPRKETTCQ